MKDITMRVRDFHEKFGFPVDQWFRDLGNPKTKEAMENVAKSLSVLSASILPQALVDQRNGDERLYRTHLMTEELGEIVDAMLNVDETKFADGLADLDYVTHGTAVTFGCHLETLTGEAHQANMTKKRPADDPRMGRPENKGRKPDFAKALIVSKYRMQELKAGV